jgi:glycyl-tRNA synthetase
MPIVVWQHGKSFRREQDQVVKNMRLKEFYQLEFQIIYADSTANDYSVGLQEQLIRDISLFVGDCRIEKSDRLPSYSESTMDIICNKTNMEICSISKRNDFAGAKVLEIAIGTDRCVYNFLDRRDQSSSATIEVELTTEG